MVQSNQSDVFIALLEINVASDVALRLQSPGQLHIPLKHEQTRLCILALVDLVMHVRGPGGGTKTGSQRRSLLNS